MGGDSVRRSRVRCARVEARVSRHQRIDDGTENHVARVIKNTFEDQLDTSRYDIEMDDEEDVLVKKDLTEPRFALELVSSTVKSVRLHVQKE